MTPPSGIEPAIFRFVAQHFNHCVTAVNKQGLEEKCVLKYGSKSRVLDFSLSLDGAVDMVKLHS